MEKASGGVKHQDKAPGAGRRGKWEEAGGGGQEEGRPQGLAPFLSRSQSTHLDGDIDHYAPLYFIKVMNVVYILLVLPPNLDTNTWFAKSTPVPDFL